MCCFDFLIARSELCKNRGGAKKMHFPVEQVRNTVQCKLAWKQSRSSISSLLFKTSTFLIVILWHLVRYVSNPNLQNFVHTTQHIPNILFTQHKSLISSCVHIITPARPKLFQWSRPLSPWHFRRPRWPSCSCYH